MSDRTPSDDRKFARDVAKQIDHRRRRRKLSLWTFLLLVIGIAALYLRFGGGGLGLLGAGEGSGEGGSGHVAGGARPLVGQKPCTLQLAREGITVDSKPMTLAEAIRSCEAIGSAHVIVTGDARQGDWDDLKVAVAKAKLSHVSFDEPGGSAAH